jgi:hypothetical protein
MGHNGEPGIGIEFVQDISEAQTHFGRIALGIAPDIGKDGIVSQGGESVPIDFYKNWLG